MRSGCSAVVEQFTFGFNQIEVSMSLCFPECLDSQADHHEFHMLPFILRLQNTACALTELFPSLPAMFLNRQFNTQQQQQQWRIDSFCVDNKTFNKVVIDLCLWSVDFTGILSKNFCCVLYPASSQRDLCVCVCVFRAGVFSPC